MTFKQLLEKHLDSMTQAELGARLGLPPDKAQKYISMWRKADANSALEKHWKLFKVIALDLDPLAIFEEPLSEDGLWRYLNLLVHLSVPISTRRPTWDRVHEIAEKILKEEHATRPGRNHPRTKSTGTRKLKARC